MESKVATAPFEVPGYASSGSKTAFSATPRAFDVTGDPFWVRSSAIDVATRGLNVSSNHLNFQENSFYVRASRVFAGSIGFLEPKNASLGSKRRIVDASNTPGGWPSRLVGTQPAIAVGANRIYRPRKARVGRADGFVDPASVRAGPTNVAETPPGV